MVSNVGVHRGTWCLGRGAFTPLCALALPRHMLSTADGAPMVTPGEGVASDILGPYVGGADSALVRGALPPTWPRVYFALSLAVFFTR